jgi:S1-C subfamily serine protease
MRAAFAGAMTLAMLAPPALAATPVAEVVAPRATLLPMEENAASVYDAALSCVVQIRSTWVEAPRAPIKGLELLLGKAAAESAPVTNNSNATGVLWDDAGHVVTMARLATPGSTFMLTLADGSRRTAKVVGTDSTLDITVLKLDGPVVAQHPIVRGSSRSLRVGQRVYVIGNPFDLTNVMTEGMLGAISTKVAGNGHPALVLNASLNPDNQGGPILDTAGRVIGLIHSSYSRGSGAALALGMPIDDIAAVVPRLIADGHVDHPRLGVQIEDGNDVELPSGLPSGVAISRADPGGAAERAGILAREGNAIDVITAIDGVEVRSYGDLRAQLDKHSAGQSCALTVWRAGKTRLVTFQLGAAKR